MNKSAWMLALAASLVVPTQVQAENRGCAQPKAGRYVVMERGLVGTEPTARLIQERWLPNGQIKGLFFERTGQDSRRERYSGTYQVQSNCQVLVQRQLSSLKRYPDQLAEYDPFITVFTPPEDIVENLKRVTNDQKKQDAGGEEGLVGVAPGGIGEEQPLCGRDLEGELSSSSAVIWS